MDGNGVERQPIREDDAVEMWLRQVFYDCGLTAETLPQELERFFGVPASDWRPDHAKFWMVVGAVMYGSLFIGAVLGTTTELRLRDKAGLKLYGIASTDEVPNASPVQIRRRMMDIWKASIRALDAGQESRLAVGAMVTSWMMECLPSTTVEPRRAEIEEWIYQEVAAYMAWASVFWPEFAEEYSPESDAGRYQSSTTPATRQGPGRNHHPTRLPPVGFAPGATTMTDTNDHDLLEQINAMGHPEWAGVTITTHAHGDGDWRVARVRLSRQIRRDPGAALAQRIPIRMWEIYHANQVTPDHPLSGSETPWMTVVTEPDQERPIKIGLAQTFEHAISNALKEAGSDLVLLLQDGRSTDETR